MSFNNPVDQPVLSIGQVAYPFIENLQNLLNANPPPAIVHTNTSAYLGMASESSGAGITDFFSVFDFNNSTNQMAISPYRLPLTWDDFVDQYRRRLGAANPGSTTGAIFDGFMTSYKQFLNITSTGPNDNPDGDFTTLAGQGITSAELKNQFVNSFNHFLETYRFPSGNSYTFGTPQQFFDNWIAYMTQTAVIQSTTGSATGSAPGLPSYEQVWTSYGFSAADFPAALKTFYDNILLQTGKGNAANGYFIPSQAFSSWMESVKDRYLGKISVSSVAGGGEDVLVIDRILRLLIQLIGILQNISVSQADRLRFLTRWQSAYTNLLIDIPTFTQGDGTAIDSNVTDANRLRVFGSNADQQKKEATQRDLINTKMQALQDKTRARRDNIGDQAKAMQSIINQSQTSANAQTEMATAFLTQLDTLLASIFK